MIQWIIANSRKSLPKRYIYFKKFTCHIIHSFILAISLWEILQPILLIIFLQLQNKASFASSSVSVMLRHLSTCLYNRIYFMCKYALYLFNRHTHPAWSADFLICRKVNQALQSLNYIFAWFVADFHLCMYVCRFFNCSVENKKAFAYGAHWRKFISELLALLESF